MPAFGTSLTEEQLASAVAFERVRFGGADPAETLTDCGLGPGGREEEGSRRDHTRWGAACGGGDNDHGERRRSRRGKVAVTPISKFFSRSSIFVTPDARASLRSCPRPARCRPARGERAHAAHNPGQSIVGVDIDLVDGGTDPGHRFSTTGRDSSQRWHPWRIRNLNAELFK